MKKAILALAIAGIVSGLFVGCSGAKFFCDMCNQEKVGDAATIHKGDGSSIIICNDCNETLFGID